MKKILITGKNSFIGNSVEAWLTQSEDEYQIDTLDMLGEIWRQADFSKYDTIFHVAGIAHADVNQISEEKKKLYYQVNTELALEVANKAKLEKVKQFIFMSSIIIYSGCKETHITKDTVPNPLNFYGDSKWQADQKLRTLESPQFKVVILRPPMIYGKGSKGNYPELSKLVTKTAFFPKVKNKRSMLHIDNLCQFIKLMIDHEESGIFFPQNGEYTNTSNMVKMIAEVKKRRLFLVPGLGWAIHLLEKFPGKIGNLTTKAFGDLYYDMSMSAYKENYIVNNLKQSIEKTEK